MGVEIERKFLIDKEKFFKYVLEKGCKISFISQGFIMNEKEKVVRVRLKNDTDRVEAFITIKSKGNGISRPEFEYPIPYADAELLLKDFTTGLITKRRYEVGPWEVDIFEGDNEGLCVAEIELTEETESFYKPDWIGKEVTNDARYLNANLIKHPFKDWE